VGFVITICLKIRATFEGSVESTISMLPLLEMMPIITKLTFIKESLKQAIVNVLILMVILVLMLKVILELMLEYFVV
jgi:hypothetical protein